MTDKPVVVINTHTHLDHLGGNRQFHQIVMFDHPVARRISEEGASRQTMRTLILAGNLFTGPLPGSFDPSQAALPPFTVSRWLMDGERINFGATELEVIHTPGEAVDHICLLDRTNRILFCGDILLHGPVWTHLEGGNLADLIQSYRRLMRYFDDFDRLMPAHNQPWLDKELLPETLAGAEKVASGQAEFQQIVDPWNQRLRQYSFGRFQILTS